VGGTAPPKRKGIAMNSNGKDALMIGGAPGMTRLNASGEAFAWETMEVEGSKPADRSFPTLTALPGGTQYLMFGGVGMEDNKPRNDVHMLTQTVVKVSKRLSHLRFVIGPCVVRGACTRGTKRAREAKGCGKLEKRVESQLFQRVFGCTFA
jgi:hypothetical protein